VASRHPGIKIKPVASRHPGIKKSWQHPALNQKSRRERREKREKREERREIPTNIKPI
jgi:hypothetical protein